MSCKGAEPGTRHAQREIHDAEGYCYTCHHARKRRRRTSGRLSAVLRLYGWTEAELAALWRSQRGRCAICLRRVGVVKEGSVDHDHALARRGVPKRWQVRGGLCSTCNRYLGHIGNDPVTSIRMALYLIDPPAPRLLAELDRIADTGRT